MSKKQEIEKEIAETQAQLDKLSKKLKEINEPKSAYARIINEDGRRPIDHVYAADTIQACLVDSDQGRFLREVGGGYCPNISPSFLHISNIGVTDSLGLFLGSGRSIKWEIVTVPADFTSENCQILIATPVADLLRAEGKLPAEK